MMILFGLAECSDSFFYSGIHAFGNLVHLRKVTSKSNAPVFRERLALHLRSKPGKCQELIDTEAFWNGAGRRPILTPCWNCFFDMLFAAFVIIIIQNGLPQRILPLCLTVKVPLFRTLSTCGWQEGRNEHIPSLRLAILGDIYKINAPFTLFPHPTPPHLCSLKESGIQTSI